MSYSIIWQGIQSSEGKKPPGRFGNAHARIGSSSIVIHGGCSWKKGSRFTFLDDLWLMRILSPTEVQWEPLSQRGQLPGRRAYHHLCVIGRKIFVFGGKSAHDDKFVCPGIHVYDYMSRSWYRQHLEQEEEPVSLGCSATVLEQQVFVFGGMTRGSVSSKTRVFQPSSSSWIVLETSGAVPPPRCDHAAAVVNFSLYIHGGCSGPDLFLSDLYQLDTNTLVWTKIDQSSSINIPRAGHSLTPHHSKDLYVFGGFNDVIYPDGGPITEDLCKFSVGQSRWKVPKPLPTGSTPGITYHHSAYIIHSHLYIIGGLGLHGMSNDVQAARLLSPSERQGTLMDDEESAYDNIYDRPATSLGDQTALASRRGKRRSSKAKSEAEDAIINLTTLPNSPEPLDKSRQSRSLEMNRKPSLRSQRAIEDEVPEEKQSTQQSAPVSQPRSPIEDEAAMESMNKEEMQTDDEERNSTVVGDDVGIGRRGIDVVDTSVKTSPARQTSTHDSESATSDVVQRMSEEEPKEDDDRIQVHSATFRNRLEARGDSSDDENSPPNDELEFTLRPSQAIFPLLAKKTSASSSSSSSVGREPQASGQPPQSPLQSPTPLHEPVSNRTVERTDLAVDEEIKEDFDQSSPSDSRPTAEVDQKAFGTSAAVNEETRTISQDSVFTNNGNSPSEKTVTVGGADGHLKAMPFPENVKIADEREGTESTDSDNEDDVEDDDDDESEIDSSIASSTPKHSPVPSKPNNNFDNGEFDFEIKNRNSAIDNLNTTQFIPDFGNSETREGEPSANSGSVASVVAPRIDIVHGTSKQPSFGGEEQDSPVPDVEVDNGNDDADSSSEEDGLNTAERQQLELLSQDLPKDMS